VKAVLLSERGRGGRCFQVDEKKTINKKCREGFTVDHSYDDVHQVVRETVELFGAN
jgi:hypothetical protein